MGGKVPGGRRRGPFGCSSNGDGAGCVRNGLSYFVVSDRDIAAFAARRPPAGRTDAGRRSRSAPKPPCIAGRPAILVPCKDTGVRDWRPTSWISVRAERRRWSCCMVSPRQPRLGQGWSCSGVGRVLRSRPEPAWLEGVQRMTRQEDEAQSITHGGIAQNTIDGATPTAGNLADRSTRMPIQRDPANTLHGCQRILILGRTGSGKTTLARELAATIGVPHVELDALYFGPDFSTAPLPVLRERTSAAIAGDRWVTDGNKSAVRDLVWPRADTVIWLDYPLVVSLWRLGRRALWRTSVLKAQATARGGKAGLARQLRSAAKGVLTALRSHKGQRREYPRMFAEQENQHLAVVRLRSPRATRRWLARLPRG